jgi:DNA-binding transcriptional LysR family regulator
MDDLELRELRYFIAVAEELNFTRAAMRLGMAQPPLSAAIGKLERKLGVTLLERTSRRVALTPAGTVLLEQGRIAVEAVGAAAGRARRAGTQPGRLTVAVKPGTGTSLLRQILQRCAGDPLIPEVHVLFGHPGGPAAAVRGGAADAAILRAPFDPRGLDAELLLTEPRVAVLPAGHRLAGRAELRRADLVGEPMPRWAGQADPASAAHWTGTDTPGLAARERGPAARGDSPAAWDHSPAARDHDPGLEINDVSQLLDAVTLGNAVAYVPVSAAAQFSSAGLAVVPVSDLSPSQVMVAWPDTSRSAAVAAFVRAALEAAEAQSAQPVPAQTAPAQAAPAQAAHAPGAL